MKPWAQASSAVLLACATLAGCNAVFGIEPGQLAAREGGGGASSSTGTTGAAGASGTGGAGGPGCAAEVAAEGHVRDVVVSHAHDFDQGNGVAFDHEGNVVVVGYFGGDDWKLGDVTLPHAGGLDVFVIKLDPQGGVVFARAFGGADDELAQGVAIDDEDDILVTGCAWGPMQVGADLIDPDLDPSNAAPDAFLMKLDADGAPLWARGFGTTQYEEGVSVIADRDSTIYLGFMSQGPVDVGGFAAGASEAWSSIVAKLDPQGTPQWARTWSGWDPQLGWGAFLNFGLGLALDAHEDLLVAGSFSGDASFGGETRTSRGGDDAFVAKLDSVDGSVTWARTWGGDVGQGEQNGDQWATSVAVDPCTDEVWVTGAFERSLRLGDAPGERVHDVVRGDPLKVDAFVAKLDDQGNLLWDGSFGDDGEQVPLGVVVDRASRATLVGYLIDGPSSQGVDFGAAGVLQGPGAWNGQQQPDAFAAKLDADGTFAWARRWGDEAPQFGWGLAANAAGALAMTGSIYGGATFDPSLPETIAADSNDAFVLYVDP